MANILGQSLLTQDLPLITEGGRPKTWDFSERGYYDLTPPGEFSEAEDFCGNHITLETINRDAEPLVAVIGVGYVGEHLVDVFSKKFNVLGYDISERRTKQLAQRFESGSMTSFTTNAKDLATATHFLISVPTLLLPDKTINSSFLREALTAVAEHARQGSVIVIESSVAVGMTRELLGPLAKERGYFAGMSPERVDPGRAEPPARSIPKVISGLDDVVPGSLDAINRLYSAAFDQIVPVSRPEVAEMMKLYENCQRMVCIAFANEMADACIPHKIDPFEVCRAASTKPFGYTPFTPSLGVGGHCIPVNPYYLLSNNSFDLLQQASEKMSARPAAIAQRAVQKLYANPREGHANARDGPLPRVLVVGMGFKPGQSHLANSPGLELAKSLVLTNKVDVAWIDPLVSQEAVPQIPCLEVGDWSVESLQERFEMIIVAFRQHDLDFDVLERLHAGIRVEMWCP